MDNDGLLLRKEYLQLLDILEKNHNYISTFDMRKKGIKLKPAMLNEKLNLLFDRGLIERRGKPRYFEYRLTNKYWFWKLRYEFSLLLDTFELQDEYNNFIKEG